jgi:hypothetical protein
MASTYTYMIIANAIFTENSPWEILPIFPLFTVHSPGRKLSSRKLIYYQKFSASQRKVVEACSASAPSLHSLSSISSCLIPHMTLHPAPAENFNFLIYLIFISFDSAHFHHIWDISSTALNIPLSTFLTHSLKHTCVRIDDVMATFAREIFNFKLWN